MPTTRPRPITPSRCARSDTRIARELAGHLELEKSSLSGLIDRAAARGLVERIPSPKDRRAATVRVTARGRRLSGVIERAVAPEVGTLVAAISPVDRARLARTARRIVAATP
jgi:DNA-binding MarR family transcriptional regulator